uniref:Uncharacterized protein n=1 Tax=viral metagenome TaxID=1070528 RepID=A0A6C0C978_9ZZZZ
MYVTIFISFFLNIKKLKILSTERCINKIIEQSNMSFLHDEFAEILSSCKKRYDNLDEDLKIQLEPLMHDSTHVPMSGIIDLFQSNVIHPKLSENENFIAFDKLPNNCIRKILSQRFDLAFTRKEDKLIMRGRSNDITIKAYYYNSQTLLAKLINEPEVPLPTNGTLIELIPKIGQLCIKLPLGYLD